MQLKELIEDMHVKSVSGSTATDITGITYDSRHVSTGHLFVALRGEKVDGHQFIDQAVDAGAAALSRPEPYVSSTESSWVKVPRAFCFEGSGKIGDGGSLFHGR